MLTSNTCTSCRACRKRTATDKSLNMTDLFARKRCVTGIRVSQVTTILALAVVCAFFIGLTVGGTNGADSKQLKPQPPAPPAVAVADAPVQRRDATASCAGP